ncbi:MAG TPA: MFS transporter [Acidimicrobiales bacterium]|nr:MFS transporter [Acidimicrobiales bacterium]
MPFSEPDKRKKILVLLAMCFALFMAMLDNTVVNVALPTISRELGAGVSGLQWIVDSYVLAFATLLLTGGILGDRYGRKRLFLGGLLGFTLASLLCALSQSTGQLVAARAFQGISAAMVMPGTLSILTVTFPVEERAQAIGIWAGVSGIALALGPTLGGWLVETAGWQSVFFLNVPIGIIGAVVAFRVVSESRSPQARKLDVVGLLLGTGLLTSITYGLIEANQYGWSDPLIIGVLSLGAVLIAAFLLWERTTAEPLLPLALFRIPTFAAGSLVALTISFGMFGTFFFASLYFQVIRGYSAFSAGLHMLPLTAMITIVAPNAGRYAQKYGPRWPLTFGLTTAGTGLILMSRANAGTPYVLLAIALAIMGIGMASTMTPMTAAVMGAVGPERAGLGSATTNTSREVGGTLGIAILGTLLTTKLKSSMGHALAALSLPAATRDTLVATSSHGRLDPAALHSLPAQQAAEVQRAFQNAFMSGWHLALLLAGTAILVAAYVANRFVASEGRRAPAAAAAAPVIAP